MVRRRLPSGEGGDSGSGGLRGGEEGGWCYGGEGVGRTTRGRWGTGRENGGCGCRVKDLGYGANWY